LADDLYKSGLKEDAVSLFEENLSPGNDSHLVPPEAYLNFGTAKLESGQTSEGIRIYDDLFKSITDKEKAQQIKSIMEKNLVTHFKKMEQKEKQKKENDKNKNNQDQQNKDQENKGQSGDSQNDNQQKNNQKDKEGPQDPKQNKSNENKNDDQDQNKKSETADEKDSKDQNDKQPDTKDNQGERLPPKKLPAKLKQLMSDDRQIQMKIIENGTRDLNKRRSRKSKDW